jgi:hypothetical protein
MITPETIPTPVRLSAKVNAADLATLIGAVASANVIALPTGKTLSDVVSLNLNVLPHAQPDGTIALLTAGIK